MPRATVLFALESIPFSAVGCLRPRARVRFNACARPSRVARPFRAVAARFWFFVNPSMRFAL